MREDGGRREGYEGFLAQLEGVSAFLAQRPGMSVSAANEDPDVRRVIEAMAYFSARSQAALEAGMLGAVRRMASAPVEELARLSPAAGLLQFAPSAELVGPVSIPAATLLRCTAPTAGRAETPSFFTTSAALDVRPVELASARIEATTTSVKLRLELRAKHAQSGAFELPIAVRRLQDYRPSARLYDALRRGTRAARARFDGRGEPSSVAVDFGARGRSSLAGVRAALHLPEAELLVRLKIPSANAPWKELAIELELDPSWPVDLRVDKSCLQLFTVAAQNVWSDPCAPVLFDGAADAIPLRIGSSRPAVELVEVEGVYDADRDLVPLVPFSLGTQPEGWELLDSGHGPSLRVRLARAIERPAKLVVDARWSQPELWPSSGVASKFLAQKQALKGQFSALGGVRRAERSRLAQDADWALEVQAMRGRRSLSRAELVALVEAAGASGESPFRGVPSMIAEVSTALRADARGGSDALVRAVTLRWKPLDEESAAVARHLEDIVRALLDALYESPVVLSSNLADDRGAPL